MAGDNLDGITINGEKISDDDSEEATTLTITDGELKTTTEPIENPTDTEEEFLDKLKKENPDAITISGRENISLSGGDLAIVEEISAKASITASKGNDTIYSRGENVLINLRGGDTNIFAKEGRMTVAGYNASTGAGFSTDYEDIFAAVSDSEIIFNDGKLAIGTAVIVDGSGDNKLVNIFDANGELQKVGEAPHDDVLNLSKEKADLILVASENSTLASGAGNDSIFASAGSHVDAGAGRNYIEIKERGANEEGVTVALNEGRNTIAYFKAGFDDDSDRLFFDGNDATNFKFDGTNLNVRKKNNPRCGILSDIADGADFVNILATDSNSVSKVVVAQKGAVITVEDEIADLYKGDESGVDFTNYEENLVVRLGATKAESVGGGEIVFGGINRVTLGGGLNTLISSSANETLTGNGTTEYIFDKDSGRDVISNFNFDEDKINVGNETIAAVNVNNSGGVRMEISGDAVLTLNDAQGKNFRVNEFTALVDKNLTYDAAANYFVATAQNATLTVGESAEIWLDVPAWAGSKEKTFVGDIRTIDASTAEGNTSLAGNDLDNTILAGNGDASLWGGNGGDDLLVGGAGKNTFFYTNGNGSDTIAGANGGDIVNLSQVTLDQIASANITADGVAINFKDGGSLQVNSNANVTYQLADDSKYSANHEQSTWIAK